MSETQGKECRNLLDAQVGQLVKAGRSDQGPHMVVEVVAVWKNGVIVIERPSIFNKVAQDQFNVEPNGLNGWIRGAKHRYQCASIWPFDEGETAEGFKAKREAAEEVAKRKAQAAATDREREVQAKIEAALISHHKSQELPGFFYTRWVDAYRRGRTTIYAVKEEQEFDYATTKRVTVYKVVLTDFRPDDESFSSASSKSRVSPEDAVNRWIASRYSH